MKLVFNIYLMLIITLACWHTSIFTNSAFWTFFVLCFGCIPLSIITVYSLIKRKQKERVSIPEILFFVWIAYILIHTIINGDEEYYILSLVCSLLFFLSIVTGFKNFGSSPLFEILLIGISNIEAIAGILQKANIIASLSPFFNETGTFENPNISAILIAFGIPVTMHLLFSHSLKHIYRAGLLFSLSIQITGITLFHCRTAWLMAIVSTLIIIGKNLYVIKWWNQQSILQRISCISILLILSGHSGWYLYNMKKPSADGRILIWETSWQMIKESPWVGTGYGLFERNYNLKQAQRLQKKEITKTAKNNARCVFTAYNEPLEQTVQGGIIGGCLFIALWLGFLLKSRKQSPLHIALATSVCILSIVNFLINGTTVWIVTLLIWARIASIEDSKDHSISSNIKSSIIILLLFFTTPSILHKVQAHYFLKQSQLNYNRNPIKSIETLHKYKANAGTSESYLRIYGQALLRNGQIEDAKNILEEARNWSSHPAIYWNLYKCYRQIGDSIQAEKCLQYLINQNVKLPQSKKDKLYNRKDHKNTSFHPLCVTVPDRNPRSSTK